MLNKRGMKMKNKKIIFLISLFFLMSILLLLPVMAQIESAGISNYQPLEAFFDGFIAAQMDEYKVPGVTMSIVKDGEIILAKGYGFSDIENQKKVDPEKTMFRPGSITKLFVWTAVMQLVEQDKIDLNQDINTYLDFSIPNHIRGFKDTLPREKITMNHLLNHTAGFEDQASYLFVDKKEGIHPLGEYLKNHIPARVYPPGQQMAYSNYSANLAAYIVERISGVNFDEYVEKNIFSPLNMQASTLRQPIPEKIQAESAYGYNFKKGDYYKGDFEFIQGYPAGSLSSTARDMAKFMIAHLEDDVYENKRILAEETKAFMHSQSFTHHEELAGMAHGFIEMNINGYHIISHGGDTQLFHSGLYLIPQENIGLFVSYNGSNSHRARNILIREFMNRYFPSSERTVTAESNNNFVDPELLQGTYHMNRANFTTYESLIRLIQQLNIQIDDENNIIQTFMGETTRLEQVKPAIFHSKEGLDRFYAPINEQGKITHLWTNSPNVIVRASWYETLPFNLLLLFGYILLALISIIIWVKSIFKRNSAGKRAIFAKFIGILYALTALVIFAGLFLVFSDMHPEYGIPNILLQGSSTYNKLSQIIWILPLLAFLLFISFLTVWIKRSLSMGGRIYYSIFIFWSFGILWWFYYWNILKW